jgi:hypothetical protein
MGSLFEGQPKTATSYVSSTSEMPKWMQDAVYNQIQISTNLANKPYEAYEGQTVAGLSPMQQQAYEQVQKNVGTWRPDMAFASSGMKDLSGQGTAAQLMAGQAPYMRPGLVGANLNAGQNYFNQAGGMNVVGAAQPFVNQAGTTTAEALSERAMAAANPFLQSAAQTSASQVGQYMSPFQQGVLDVIAKQGARNLRENILPGVSDAFVRAGQFGSSRMGEFGSRAVRDTQEAILNQQAQAAQQGYNQSLAAAQADLARQGQLAGTAGSISGADLSRVLQGGAQYGNLGQISGQLTSQQMQNLGNLAQMQTGAGQAQQNFGLTAAQQAQQAQAQDYARQMSALQQMAAMAQQGQAMGFADTGALEAGGTAQQRQAQAQLDAAKAQFDAEQLYPRQMTDWLNTQVRGMAPVTPTATTGTRTTTGDLYSPSPLSTFATGIYTAKGLGAV